MVASSPLLGPSLARSREARFACPNRRACSQAITTTTVHTESIKVLYHVKVITIIIIIIIIITIIIMTMMKNNNKNKSNTKWYFVDHVTVESR